MQNLALTMGVLKHFAACTISPKLPVVLDSSSLSVALTLSPNAQPLRGSKSPVPQHQRLLHPQAGVPQQPAASSFPSPLGPHFSSQRSQPRACAHSLVSFRGTQNGVGGWVGRGGGTQRGMSSTSFPSSSAPRRTALGTWRRRRCWETRVGRGVRAHARGVACT